MGWVKTLAPNLILPRFVESSRSEWLGRCNTNAVYHFVARIFDIENDPKEMWNVVVSNSWIEPLGLGLLANYTKSIMEFPNIHIPYTI